MSGYVGSTCTLARSLNVKSDLKKLKSVNCKPVFIYESWLASNIHILELLHKGLGILNYCKSGYLDGG